MDRKLLIITGALGVSVLAFLFLPQRAFGFTTVDAATGEVSNGLGLLASGTDRQNAARVSEYFNRTRYNGWFNDPKHSLGDVLAVWRIESVFKPTAINRNDGGANNHAYGIGQVLGSTAVDFGVSNPSAMLNLEVGARVSMDYMKWSYEFLEARLNREPTKAEWIGSYNAGVGAVLAGRIPSGYLAKFYASALIA